MARDDDDDDRPRDEDSHYEDDDRPTKKKSRKEEDEPAVDPGDVSEKPLPLRLVGAIIASIFWGGMMLYGSCINFSHSAMLVVAFHRANAVFVRGAGGGVGGEGYFGTLAATQFLMFLLGGALLAGGILLLLRKGYAKWMAMGVPAAMVLLQMGSCVVCLMITSGEFLSEQNFQFLINILFNLSVGGANAYLLLHKDVAKVLK